MIGLVWSAIRSRGAQALSIWALTLLAVAAAAATPWYAQATQEAVIQRHVDAAPATQRVLVATVRPQKVSPVVDPQSVADQVAQALAPLPLESAIHQLALRGIVNVGGTHVQYVMTSRDGVCEHSAVDGACPTAPNQVIIGQTVADQLGVKQGGTIVITPDELKTTVTLTVTGIYRKTDPLDQYWYDVATSGLADPPPLYTVPETLTGMDGVRVTSTANLRLAGTAYDDDLPHRIDIAASGLYANHIAITTYAADLARAIAADKAGLTNGVAVAAGRLILLCGFALFVAVRHTAQSHRKDLGLVRLRGVRRWRIWSAMLGPMAVPIVAGGVVGGLLGFLGALALAGPVHLAADQRTALVQFAGAVLAVMLAAIVVAVAAQLQSGRAPVGELLRDVPARVRTGRALDAVELVVLLLAGVGVWQLVSVAQVQGDTAAPVVVPALLALAAGLLVSRVLLRLAVVIATGALRAGRLPAALAALSASRRPALRWVVTLLTVAVAGLAGAVGESVRAAPAVADRAEQELGASQVLTVSAPSRLALRDAVRAADPDGKYAMAVAAFAQRVGVTNGVLAVDLPRLGATALWRPEYGPIPVAPATEPTPIKVADGPLTLDVSEDAELHREGSLGDDLPDSTSSTLVSPDVYAIANLVDGEGRPVPVVFGPLRPATREYTMDAKCPGGCRLQSISLVHRVILPAQGGAPMRIIDNPPAWGTQVHLHSLRQGTADVIGTARFAERDRWHGPADSNTFAPVLAGELDGLRMAAPPDCTGQSRGVCTLAVLPADLPLPLPAVVAGKPQYSDRIFDLRLELLGGGSLPVRVEHTARVLPQLGGEGAIVDLTQFDALLGPTLAGEQWQVWLSADAPPSVVDSLTQHNIQVLRTRTVAAARAEHQGDAPAAVRTFALLAAILGLVIAAVALLLSASAGRAATAGDLVALRGQGLYAKAVPRIGLAGYGWPAVAAAVTGLVVAMIAGQLPVPPPKLFADGWQVLPPPPGGVSPLAAGIVAVASAVAVFLAVAWSARRLTEAVRNRAGGAR
ncbi:FtsX-like permease family protein [Hamadaea tsunoensis]|uniref:FtsX-like permease family protein n=1 Tax=Hamadaea tsunoensis TaxID=53368 RepID=UPI0004184842|nr:FtsX-like permease family protein [Hamadaea tsunoensis]